MPRERLSRKEKIPPQEGVIFLLFRDGLVLMERRSLDDPRYPGQLLVPGGKSENDETPRETIKREIEEELGLDGVFRARFLGSYAFTDSTGQKYLPIAYLITDFKGEIINREPAKSTHVWLSIDEAWRQAEQASTRYVLLLAKMKLNEVRPQAG